MLSFSQVFYPKLEEQYSVILTFQVLKSHEGMAIS